MMCRTQKVCLAVGMLAGLAMCSTTFAADTPEVEPNDSKATATVVAAMAPGDTITGNSIGSFSSPAGGANSADYWNITTTPAPAPGLYEYVLSINETTTVGHTLYIRGLAQTASGISAGSDSVAQTAQPTQAHFLRWYANEQPSRIIIKITGTTATTPDYVMTLARNPITPNAVPGAIDPGMVVMTTVGQTSANTEMWLYDSSFNPVPGAGNDDESVAGGGAGTTTQSRLQRNLPAGTYILAISPWMLANNLAAPADDRTKNGAVLDYPNALCTTSLSSTAVQDLDFTIGGATGTPQSITNSASFLEISFWRFTVGTPVSCGTSDFNGDGDFGTDQDIESFFACLGGNCCATCFPGGSDFNGDGDVGTDQDIESFFRVLGGGNC